MKRPIKFRAKCAKRGKWIFGYYGEYISSKNEVRHGILEADQSVHVVTIDPNTLGQLVTVKDGKEIYEGDILVDRYTDEDDKIIKGHFPILWDGKEMCWSIDSGFTKDGTNLISLNEFFGDALEVSGNVIDNPELLTV